MPDNDIVIDLNSSNHNRPVGSYNELIQRAAFDALKLQIAKDLDKASADARGKAVRVEHNGTMDERYSYPHGSGLTYFIDGTRGAGKSTFLIFVCTHLREHLHSHLVEPLLYLDPSRIETSEVVLLHILKHLKRLMEDSPDHGRDRGKYQEQFRELFKQMAGGLHLFVSKTESLKDLDPELFLDYGLDRAADSQRLRDLLHQTIDLVCHVHKVSALLLAIDDADTKFAHAIEVLECIRKYLDTPKVVVLVTGDMEMYSLLVQSHFQQDFASNDRGFSPDRKNQQTRMVAHLEEQYLLKLFPIQRRVQLKTLYTLAERIRKDRQQLEGNARPELFINLYADETRRSLVQAIDGIAKSGVRLRDRLDLELFREHVLKLPVRSVVQLLSTFYQLRADASVSERAAAADALRATALSSLYRYDVDVESIAEGDLYAVINAAFDLCQLDGDPDTAIYLRPQSRNATQRNTYLSLAADVARLCECSPAKAITYMVSMAGSSNILHLVSGKTSRKEASSSVRDSDGKLIIQKQVKQYLSVGRKESALNWAIHATAALIGASNQAGLQLRQGIIGLRSSGIDAVKFDRQLASASKAKSMKLIPAIAFCRSAVKRPYGTSHYLSIFNALGLISNLLELDFLDKDHTRKQILKQLNKIKSVQTVSLSDWDDLAARDEDADELPPFEADTGDGSTDELSGWAVQIEDWLRVCQKLRLDFHPSAVLMGKIWNRLYFSLDNISAAMRQSTHAKDRCSKAMELFAWALINACLVEEIDYHATAEMPSDIVLNRYNPRTSGVVVINKFSSPSSSARHASIDIIPRMAPLAFMVASCPLILGLIRRDSRTTRFSETLDLKLTDYRGEYHISSDLLCDQEVWLLIGQTTISK